MLSGFVRRFTIIFALQWAMPVSAQQTGSSIPASAASSAFSHLPAGLSSNREGSVQRDSVERQSPLAEQVERWVQEETATEEDAVASAVFGALLGAVAVGALGWVIESNSEACQDVDDTCGYRGAIIGATLGAAFGGVAGYLIGKGNQE